jgi:hypothetical protein
MEDKLELEFLNKVVTDGFLDELKIHIFLKEKGISYKRELEINVLTK